MVPAEGTAVDWARDTVASLAVVKNAMESRDLRIATLEAQLAEAHGGERVQADRADANFKAAEKAEAKVRVLEAQLAEQRERVDHWRVKAECYGGMVRGCSPAFEAAGFPIDTGGEGGGVGGIKRAAEAMGQALAEQREALRKTQAAWDEDAKKWGDALAEQRERAERELREVTGEQADLEAEVAIAFGGFSGGDDDNDMTAVEVVQWAGAKLRAAEERIRLAQKALVATGYFSEHEVGDDVAPRITEYASHAEESLREANERCARLRKAADTAAEAMERAADRVAVTDPVENAVLVGSAMKLRTALEAAEAAEGES